MSVVSHIAEKFRTNGAQNATEYVREAFAGRRLRPEQVSLQELAQTSFGVNWPVGMRAYAATGQWARESIDPITPDIFGAVAGQMLIERTRAGFDKAILITESLVEVIPNTRGNLGKMKDIYPSMLTDSPSQISPGMPYPVTGMSVEYTEIPEPVKNGVICFITEETIYTDNTRKALEAAEDLGKHVGQQVENERLAVILGYKGNYNRNGTTMATYISAASGMYRNDFPATPFVDWNSIDTVEQNFSLMIDPVRKEPVGVMPNQILCTRNVRSRVNYTLNQAGTRVIPPSATGGTEIISTEVPIGEYEVFNSQWVDYIVRQNSSGDPKAAVIVYADFKKAFGWREVYPLEIYRANAQATDLTPSGPLGFRDIVFAIKARTYGVAFVQSPWHVIRTTATLP